MAKNSICVFYKWKLLDHKKIPVWFDPTTSHPMEQRKIIWTKLASNSGPLVPQATAQSTICSYFPCKEGATQLLYYVASNTLPQSPNKSLLLAQHAFNPASRFG